MPLALQRLGSDEHPGGCAGEIDPQARLRLAGVALGRFLVAKHAIGEQHMVDPAQRGGKTGKGLGDIAVVGEVAASRSRPAPRRAA